MYLFIRIHFINKNTWSATNGVYKEKKKNKIGN